MTRNHRAFWLLARMWLLLAIALHVGTRAIGPSTHAVSGPAASERADGRELPAPDGGDRHDDRSCAVCHVLGQYGLEPAGVPAPSARLVTAVDLWTLPELPPSIREVRTAARAPPRSIGSEV